MQDLSYSWGTQLTGLILGQERGDLSQNSKLAQTPGPTQPGAEVRCGSVDSANTGPGLAFTEWKEVGGRRGRGRLTLRKEA